MPVRVGMVSLGCAKNQVDAERMLYRIQKDGYQLVSDAALSDVVVVNTCGFIQSAKEEAIETILEFAELKKEGRIKHIIVTGCLAQRYKDELLSEIPEADAAVGLGSNDEICDIIKRVTEGEKVSAYGPKLHLPLTGGRVQTTLPYYSYLKIAEGCSNCCSFCAIPQIRGKFRSVPMEELVCEAEQLAANGVTELVLIAQDSTQYGTDIYGEPKLAELLRKLCRTEGLRWIRVLYCYPERMTDELLDVIAEEEKIVKYIEMPIQHINDRVLGAMRRTTTGSDIREKIRHIRERIPGVILRTTLLVGFPGETEEEFEELSEFVQQTRFDRLGCFAYSPEEGTAAAKMDGQVDDDVKERRAELIMEQQAVIMAENNEKLIGRTLEVIVEGFDRYGECYFGRSAMDAPEIDGKIFFASPDRKLEMGMYVDVCISDVMDYDLIGDVVFESAE
ncbi:MAG: 30S ribosomal protein S12 methylthiotransferase RimO [Oscillospiraceae bacterium]|nr:30S ribosomal protein S12 methylthiotransferase RimO [Oscillospiraceae bacterium]